MITRVHSSLRPLVHILPAAILIFWWAAYLRGCLVTLAAPGRPIQFRYRAQAGYVTVEADSYSASLARGRLLVSRPQVLDPLGHVVARASSLEFKDLDWKRGANQRIELRIDHLRGRLVRLPTGSFELPTLLPPKGKTKTTLPLHVLVNDASVTYVDQTGHGWEQAAYSRKVEVSGLGTDWVAHGQVTLPSVGSLDAEAQYLAGIGLRVSGSTKGLEAGTAASHFLETESGNYQTLRALRVARLQISGPFTVMVPVSKDAPLKASSHIDAEEVSLGRYSVDHLSFTGRMAANGVEGFGTATARGISASFQGSGLWGRSETASGRVQASVSGDAELPSWARTQLPNGLHFSDLTYDGWLAFGKGQELEANGILDATSATYRRLNGRNLKVQLAGDTRQLRLNVLQAVLAGTQASGSAELNLQSRTVSGWVRADSPDLSEAARLLGFHGISGEGSVTAILGGAIANPTLAYDASGEVGYQAKGVPEVGRQAIQAAGTYRNRQLLIDRAVIQGPAGTLTASGGGKLGETSARMHIEGRDVDLSKLVSGAGGLIDLTADFSGNLKSPKAVGRIEGTNLSYRGHAINAAQADVTADRNSIAANHLAAVSGTMNLAGQAAYSLTNGKISGQLAVRGIQANDYLGPNFAGIFDAPGVQLSGTAKDPLIEGDVTSRELVAQNLILRDIRAKMTASRKTLQVTDASTQVAGGDVSANGSYSFVDHSGEVNASSTPLDLSRLAPSLGAAVALNGSVKLTRARIGLSGSGAKDLVLTGNAAGSLDKVVINGVSAGDGNWSLDSNGEALHGSLSIGSLIPELRVLDADATYDLKTRTLAATADADRMRIGDLAGALSRYLPATLTANPDTLSALTGDLTFASKVTGKATDPDVVFSTLQASNLQYKGQAFGSLTANGVSRVARKWTVPGAELDGPEGKITASGNAIERGTITASAQAADFHLSSLSPFSGAFAGNPGTVTFSASASGMTSDPEIKGSLTAAHLAKVPTDFASTHQGADDLSIEMPMFTVGQGNIISSGKFGFAGFEGTFSEAVPFTFRAGFGDAAAHANVTLNERPLNELPLLSDYLDPTRSTGTLAGSVSIDGPLNSLSYAGGLNLVASTAGIRFPGTAAYIKRLDDTIGQFTASLQLTPKRTIEVKSSGTLQRGGRFDLTASTALVDLTPALSGNLEPVLRQFMSSPVSGTFKVDQARFRQGAPGGYLAAAITGSTTIGGTISRPEIGNRANPGTFSISDLSTAIPTLPAAGGEAAELTIDPSFAIDAKLANPAHIRTATADLNLTGDGKLRGKLSDPIADANLVVDQGTVQLPGGTVRLDQGGTVDFTYRHPFAETPVATLDVDIQGRTAVTALRPGGNPQRYDVSLDIRGDLLKENALTMNATTDPPDLSSQDVLELLGEKGVFESLGTAGQNEAVNRISQALAGFAIPTVLSPFNASLARSLGLDYVSFEYNEFQQTTVDVARALSKEFTLQYLGQIGLQPTATRPIHDLRLVYTPLRVPGALRHYSLAFGTDQDHPWKVALEYGIRFGSTGPALTKKTQLKP